MGKLNLGPRDHAIHDKLPHAPQIVEVVREVPVEKIVIQEVTRIVEVPVEVIKEVPIIMEKIVNVEVPVFLEKLVEVEKTVTLEVEKLVFRTPKVMLGIIALETVALIVSLLLR